MRGIWGINPAWGITAVRLAVAIILIVAGYQKFAGGIPGVQAFMGKVGIPLPGLMGWYIPILELVGGILLLIGLAGRWVGLLVTLEFIVAAFYVKFPTQGWSAGRIDLTILAGAILLFLAGSGKASVDEVWLEKQA
ncbi:MAG: DoxX family protein [Candidatus Rokubacteria bacterium]|jgi:putative oxidoreductase|nr:DoxX family protein [Candidatus Rokubacteria bacterium]MBI4255427.1 DoxX family protein [Candidatus Rokubacteria bacterium]